MNVSVSWSKIDGNFERRRWIERNFAFETPKTNKFLVIFPSSHYTFTMEQPAKLTYIL